MSHWPYFRVDPSWWQLIYEKKSYDAFVIWDYDDGTLSNGKVKIDFSKFDFENFDFENHSIIISFGRKISKITVYAENAAASVAAEKGISGYEKYEGLKYAHIEYDMSDYDINAAYIYSTEKLPLINRWNSDDDFISFNDPTYTSGEKRTGTTYVD